MKSLAEWCKENSREDILKKWSQENEIAPNEISYGSAQKVKWVCDKNHCWEATPNKMTQRESKGCPYCSNQKVWRGFNDLKTIYPDIANEWNIEKNGKLQPTDVTAHSNIKVWWVCPLGHEYKSPISWRTDNKRQRNCPYCANKRLLKGYNDLATVCPDVAREWHPTKNGDLTPDAVLSSTSKKIWWLCPKGHTYISSLNSRVNKGQRASGCPVCAGRQVLRGYNDLSTVSPSIAKEWHPTKNGNIKPDNVLSGSHKKYWWICPIGHEYLASPENRTKNNRTGCPICASQRQTSFPEQALYYYLKKVFPDAKSRHEYKGKEIDIFIPSLRIGIEYDGYRYHTKETEDREEKKNLFCKKEGIRLFRIKECDAVSTDRREDVICVRRRGKYEETIPIAFFELIKSLNMSGVEIDVDIIRDRTEILNQYYVALEADSFATRYPELVGEWDEIKNGELKIHMFSAGSGVKVWWRCAKKHSYNMSFYDRGKGLGCPICAGQKLEKGFNDLKTKFPDIANELDFKKNHDLLPDEIMPGSNKRVWWKCEKGHSYQATVASRTSRKSGCPYCSGYKAIQGETDLFSNYPWINKYWDYEENNSVDPSLLSPYTHKKVGWVCKQNHRFIKPVSEITTYYDKYRTFRCPICNNRIKKVLNIDTGEIFVSLEAAAKSCGLKKGDTISYCCKGKQEKAGGFHWKYVDIDFYT